MLFRSALSGGVTDISSVDQALLFSPPGELF